MNQDLINALWDGTQVTVQLTVLSILFGTVVAILSGIAGLSPFRVVRWANQVFVDFFRGSSAIIQLFWIFYALPLISRDLSFSPMVSGVLVLGLNMGAYGSEVVRGALRAVPQGQTEASIALNLNSYQRMRYVIFPQAVVAMLPPYGNLVIELLKGTALVSLITLSDLAWQAQILRANGTAPTPLIYGIVLVIYFILAQGLNGLVRLAERAATRGTRVTTRV